MSNETTAKWWLSGSKAIVFWFTTLVSVLLLMVSIKIRNDFANLPDSAFFAKLEFLRASLFAFALSIGLFGAVLALVAPPRRRLGSAITLFASAQILFAFVAKHMIVQRTMGHSVSPFLLIVPAALCLGSLIMVVLAGLAPKTEQKPPMEEPQSPQSQP